MKLQLYQIDAFVISQILAALNSFFYNIINNDGVYNQAKKTSYYLSVSFDLSTSFKFKFLDIKSKNNLNSVQQKHSSFQSFKTKFSWEKNYE